MMLTTMLILAYGFGAYILGIVTGSMICGDKEKKDNQKENHNE